ncbi:hypothetical protein M432DRAFT_591909 [Thermoascus aurantiacus ATCC 26904]
MSSRKAGGSRGHSSQQYRRSSVTQSELEAISSEQPETGAGRISPFAQSAQYNLCFFPGDSSLAVGDATLGLGSQLSSSDGGSRILVPGNTALQHQEWQPSFTFDRKSDRPSTSFQFEDATSGPNFGNTSSSTSHQLHPEIPPDNTSTLDFDASSYPLNVEQKEYPSDLMHSDIRDYNWANMSPFPGQQYSPNIQPFSQPEDLQPLNPPAGFDLHQSNNPQNFLHPESQLAPSFTSHSLSTSVRGPSKQQFLSPSETYSFSQPTYDLSQTSFAPPYPAASTMPESQPPTMTAAPSYFPSGSAGGGSPGPGPGPENQVRVISSRPKPQCWDHGCNGREFSTFSNLLRHQRERSGAAAKVECQYCGAVFTRTTARNMHIAQGKCKGRGSVD